MATATLEQRTISPPIDDEKARVRATVFAHLSGLVIAPTTTALSDRGVLRLLESAPQGVELQAVIEQTGANRGYLQVALRLLAAAGWLNRSAAESGKPTHYELTGEGRIAFRLAPDVFSEVVAFLPQALGFQELLFGTTDADVVRALAALVSKAKKRWGLPEPATPTEAKVIGQIRSHLDGLLVGPAMVALARGGVLTQLQAGPAALSALAGNQAGLRSVLELLAGIGWVELAQDQAALTPAGEYAASIAASYGVTVSYLPTMAHASTLLFGNARMPRFDEHGVEVLVDRGMNVWGSGGAHKTYFKKIDEIVMEIFNGPLDRQPRGICDMGCGDGTLLAHLYDVVRNRTLRGQHLDQYPLVIVGADFNKVARRVTRQTLSKAKIPRFEVIHGTINRPAQLAADLEKLGHDAHDFLHVRSFLDHNRVFAPPANYVAGTRQPKTSGAFAHLGDEVPNDVLEENLVQHLRRWAPYTGRFGLLVVELHTLPPALTAANLIRTPAVAYDGTHGYSDQYLVELPVFLDCAREAGLAADMRYQARFPASELATVSINLFTAAE